MQEVLYTASIYVLEVEHIDENHILHIVFGKGESIYLLQDK